MSDFRTEQEAFWAGDFGNSYIGRNVSQGLQTSKIALWSQMLRSAHGVGSIIEFGCNAGLNLHALQRLHPGLSLAGIEINRTAAAQAARLDGVSITCGSILDDLGPPESYDLTFTCGVLIHINPDHLEKVYANLHRLSRRYVLVAEYYNPTPVTVPYRGNQDRLFKRDFAGDLMDRHGMRLVDYGFAYHRDNWAPQDDITWFLLQK